MLKLFSRPYPSSISGTLTSFSFSLATNTFRLAYVPSPYPTPTGGWTRIAVNEDEDSGWGEWKVTIEGVGKEGVEVAKGWGEVLVRPGSEWREGEEVVVVLTVEGARAWDLGRTSSGLLI